MRASEAQVCAEKRLMPYSEAILQDDGAVRVRADWLWLSTVDERKLNRPESQWSEDYAELDPWVPPEFAAALNASAAEVLDRSADPAFTRWPALPRPPAIAMYRHWNLYAHAAPGRASPSPAAHVTHLRATRAQVGDVRRPATLDAGVKYARRRCARAAHDRAVPRGACRASRRGAPRAGHRRR